MRLLVLLGLAVVAFAARSTWNDNFSRHQIRDSAFRQGNEYRYRFDGQIANGLPLPSSQQTMTRLIGEVIVAFESQSTALLQIDKITVGTLQKEIGDSQKLQPFGLFEKVEMNKDHEKLLSLPLRFRYDHGLVSEIEFDREDQPWSENIKRSILNMLQVNMSKQGVREEQLGEMESSRSIKQNEQGEVFTAQEKTLEGECETVYTIVDMKKSFDRLEDNDYEQSDVTKGQKNGLRVTKSINFEKCSQRVGECYNYRFGDECPSCEKKWQGEQRNVESSSVFNYDIVGTPEQFIVKQTETRSQYVYAPANQQTAFFKTTVTARLVLINVEQKKGTIQMPKTSKKETLLYNNEWNELKEKFHMTGNEEFIRNTPYPDMKNKHEIVVRLLKNIVKDSASRRSEVDTDPKGVELSAPHYMARLVKVLRLVTKEEMSKIHSEVCENNQIDESEKMKEILNDVLALAGTKVTVDHLIQKIRARQVSQARAAFLLQNLANIRTPSQEIIGSLTSLCYEQKHQPAVRQTCWLTVGSLMKGVCGEQRDKLATEVTNGRKEKKQCSSQLKQQFIKELTQLFEKAETHYEKILALKTMANTAIDFAVFPLEKLINDWKQEKTIRLEAIDALRQLRSIMPRKIQNILLPIYKNIQEHPEIRIAAFNQIIQTVPERMVIDQLAQQLDKEPSRQVVSFVYSTLQSYAKSEIPCEKRMADDIHSSLQLVRVQPPKMFDSRFGRFPVYSENYKSAASLDWGVLFSNDSVLPKELLLKLETAFAGQWQKYLAQIGASQQNVDQWLAKLLKVIDEKGFEQLIVRGKRSSSLFQPAELLKNLFQKLSIQGRQLGQPDQQPHMMMYIRYRDMDYALLPINEQELPDMLKKIVRNGRIEIDELEQVLAQGYRFSSIYSTFVYERSRKIVTSMGIPVVVNTKMPTVVSLRGQINIDLQPRSGQKIDGIRMRINAQPSIATTHVTKMQTYLPIVSQGIKLLHSAQVNAPINMIVETNWARKFEIKMKIQAPQNNVRFMQIQSRPVTFMKVWPAGSVRAYIEPKEQTVYVPQLKNVIKSLDSQYICKVSDLTFKIDGHIHGHFWPTGSLKKLIPSAFMAGENTLEVAVLPTPHTPKEYVMTIELEALNDQIVMEKPENFQEFYEKDNSKHFQREQLGDYDHEHDSHRVSSFKTYVRNFQSTGAISNRLRLSAQTIGGQQNKNAQIEMRTVCDNWMRFCKIEVDARRSPLGEERQQWTASVRLESLYPELPSTLFDLKEQKHREYTATVMAKWGSEQKNNVDIKIQGEQNKQQMAWIRRLQQQKQQGKVPELSVLEEYSQLLEASMLNQYKAVVNYNINSQKVNGMLEKCFSLLKAYTLLSTEIEPVNNQHGRLLAQLTVEPETRQYVNVTIETPRELVKVQDIRLPYPLRLVNIRRQYSSVNSISQLGDVLIESQRAECRVQSNKVNTFDDVTFRAPITTCYSVLAKDCSDRSQPEFAVLMKKIQNNKDEKKIKIISQKHIVEVEKKTNNGEIIVKVDGEKIQDEQKLAKIGVYKQGDSLINVQLPQVNVQFDGYTAEIKLSELYKSQQCGICGHYDGERQNELRKADNYLTDNIEDFHRSYLVTEDEECDMDNDVLSQKRNYELLSKESSSSSSSEEDDRNENSAFSEMKPWKKNNAKFQQHKYDDDNNKLTEPLEKTRVIEYPHKICFSKQPVPECPRKSYDQDKSAKQIHVSFGCMPRSSQEASRLLREARHKVILTTDLEESFVQTLDVPTYCIVY